MKISHVSFTGTRAGMTNAQKETFWALLQELGVETFTHGNCMGADADAHVIARRLGLCVRKRPSNIQGTQAVTEGGEVVAEPDEPLKRDRDIVDDGMALIACPDSKQEKQRSGTWYTMRYAWKCKKLVYTIFPDGDVVLGTSKETSGPEYVGMSIIDASSDINRLLIKCGCGYYHTHRSDRWKLSCLQCENEASLEALRDIWMDCEKRELLDRLGAQTLPITKFQNDYRGLSNFWKVSVELDGVRYPSTENAYQAAKTLDLDLRKEFVELTPGGAKKARQSDCVTSRLGICEDRCDERSPSTEVSADASGIYLLSTSIAQDGQCRAC